MTLGLPTWTWLPVAVGVWLVAATWRVLVGPELRARHRLTCRVYWQTRVVLDAAESVAAAVLWLAFWPGPVAFAVIGLDVVSEGACVLRLLLGRHSCRPDAWTCEQGHRHYASGMRIADVCHEAWRHRDHDDDCDHGPARRRDGAAARLRSWAKVALNPAFAPA